MHKTRQFNLRKRITKSKGGVAERFVEETETKRRMKTETKGRKTKNSVHFAVPLPPPPVASSSSINPMVPFANNVPNQSVVGFDVAIENHPVANDPTPVASSSSVDSMVPQQSVVGFEAAIENHPVSSDLSPPFTSSTVVDPILPFANNESDQSMMVFNPPSQFLVNNPTSSVTGLSDLQLYVFDGINCTSIATQSTSSVNEGETSVSSIDHQAMMMAAAADIDTALNESNAINDEKPGVFPNVDEIIVLSDNDTSGMEMKTEPKDMTQVLLENESLRKKNRKLELHCQALQSLVLQDLAQRNMFDWSLPGASSTMKNRRSANDTDKENSSE